MSKSCNKPGMVEGEKCVLPLGHDDSMGCLPRPRSRRAKFEELVVTAPPPRRERTVPPPSRPSVTLTFDEWKRVVIILRGDASPHPVDDALLGEDIKKQVEDQR